MPTVDDLVVSVRIDETSNLGKLQKQLTALVGKDGTKAIDISDLDPGLKRDIAIIKDRIIKFTPTVLVGENVKEAALNLGADLKTNKNLTKVMLQRYNINIDKYEAFILELFNITRGISKMNSDQAKGFIATMSKFRMVADMERGQRETLVKRLTRMLLESGFHEKVIDIFREVGLKVLSKPAMHEMTRKSIGKSFDDIIKEYEKDEPKFTDLKKIFDDNTNSLKAITKAVEFMKGGIFDITEVTKDMIEKDKELTAIIVAQVASSLKKNTWMTEQFYQAGKTLFTKGKAFGVIGPAYLDTIIHNISSELKDEVGIKHIVGDEIDDSMTNFLAEYKTVAGKQEVNAELLKRAIDQKYDEIFFIVEEYTEDAKNAIEEFREKAEHQGIKVGLYQLTPRFVQKALGIAPDLDIAHEEAKKVIEDQEEKELEQDEEKNKVMAALQDLNDISSDIKEIEGESTEEIKKAQDEENRQLEELMKAMGELKEVADDTNAEVKKEDFNEPNREEGDGG